MGAPVEVPLAEAPVHAGFPSPADDHAEDGLDLTRRFVRHPTSTFVVRATGDSLSGRGVLSGDYLVVDRARTPRDGDIVLAIVDGAFAAKVVEHDRGGRMLLTSAHPAYPPIPWRDGCEIWGVATSVHRDLLTAAR